MVNSKPSQEYLVRHVVCDVPFLVPLPPEWIRPDDDTGDLLVHVDVVGAPERGIEVWDCHQREEVVDLQVLPFQRADLQAT